jgi:hypothetical protein
MVPMNSGARKELAQVVANQAAAAAASAGAGTGVSPRGAGLARPLQQPRCSPRLTRHRRAEGMGTFVSNSRDHGNAIAAENDFMTRAIAMEPVLHRRAAQDAVNQATKDAHAARAQAAQEKKKKKAAEARCAMPQCAVRRAPCAVRRAPCAVRRAHIYIYTHMCCTHNTPTYIHTFASHLG